MPDTLPARVMLTRSSPRWPWMTSGAPAVVVHDVHGVASRTAVEDLVGRHRAAGERAVHREGVAAGSAVDGECDNTAAIVRGRPGVEDSAAGARPDSVEPVSVAVRPTASSESSSVRAVVPPVSATMTEAPRKFWSPSGAVVAPPRTTVLRTPLAVDGKHASRTGAEDVHGVISGPRIDGGGRGRGRRVEIERVAQAAAVGRQARHIARSEREEGPRWAECQRTCVGTVVDREAIGPRNGITLVVHIERVRGQPEDGDGAGDVRQRARAAGRADVDGVRARPSRRGL